MKDKLNVLIISPEVFPFAKTGGLADVTGALPEAIAKKGHKCSVILPLYQLVRKNGFMPQVFKKNLIVKMNNKDETFDLYLSKYNAVSVYFIDKKEYYGREFLYGTPKGDYEDNAQRFAFFAKAIIASIPYIGRQDIYHCNDWQSALVPLYLKLYHKNEELFKNTRTVFTIHNMAYQGLFNKGAMQLIDIPENLFIPSELEFYSKLSFMKAGILYSDAITTVSEGYRNEVLTPEFGCGLDGLLKTREKNFYGIINGVDYAVWNPAIDKFIAKTYTPENMHGKIECKKDLLKEFDMKYNAQRPLIGMITRLAEQKGIDLVGNALKDMIKLGADFVLLGFGDEKYNNLFKDLAKKHKGHVGVKIAFDNALSHKIEAGCDMFLIPSRYEPCGLNQMYSLKYATVSIVRAVGGLDDTVQNFNPMTKKGNGFKFKNASVDALLKAIKDTIAIYKDKKLWQALLNNCMSCDFSWDASAEKYLRLYKNL